MDKKELFKNFEANWGRFITPFEIEDISKWIDEDGFSVEVVNEALRETVTYQVKTLHYLNRVLANWKANGVTTLEAVKYTRQQWQENRKPKQSGYQSPFAQGRESNVPAWVNEPFKTEATPEELVEMEKLKKEMMGDT